METPFENLRHQSKYLLTSLMESPTIDGAFRANVNFSGYSSLFCTIADLMKLCTLALLSDEPHVSPLVSGSAIDLAGILELAIQLIPRNEAEFLDEAGRVFRNDPQEQLPKYNYSTIRLWEKSGS